MEILNNIWIAISTPNEDLINVLSVPLIFIEAYLSLLIFTSILNIKTNKKQKLLYVIISSLIGLISANFLPDPYNLFLNYMFVFIIIYLIFKLNVFKTLLAIILPVIIFGLVNTLIFNPFLNIFNIEDKIAQTIPMYRISYVALSDFIVAGIVFILKRKNLYINIIEEFDRKTKLICIFSLILGFIALCTQLIIAVYYTSTLPIIISILSFIFLLAYFVISIYNLSRIVKLTHTTKQLENAEEYNKTLQILHDSVRGFKHDYDNTVATIGGFIKTNDMDGLKEYYNELEDEVIKVSSLYMLNPNIINNPGIYSLLATKYHKADKLNIKINLTVLLDLNTINMKIYDFTKIFGILLDNSIDAAKECEDKVINITFKNDDKNNRQLLIIENTYQEKDIDINKIFEKGITSKENHTGLGLWEIQKILKRNNNLNLHTSKNDKYFSQQFEIYKT